MKKAASRKGAKTQSRTRRVDGLSWRACFASLRLCVRFVPLACLVCYSASVIVHPRGVAASGASHAIDERAALIEAASFKRVEFFGAQALVPYPTLEARNRLADVAAHYPDDANVSLKLAQLDEQLGRNEDAAHELARYVVLTHDSTAALDMLAAFYERRADFPQAAATLERLLARAPADERTQVMQRLIELARVHQISKYLAPAFYEQVIAQDPSAFASIVQYIDKLSEQHDNAAALKVLRAHKAQFPERTVELIEKEAALLDALGRAREGEQVYEAAFDPLWPDELSRSFYEFLSEHDHLRAYGRELRTQFKRDPTSYNVAVRLLHYADYMGEADPSIFVELEQARAARGVKWRPEELATVARLLLASGYADAASRFLYTLYLQGGLKPGGELRAKVLYQLFALLADAGDERLALTKGDLKFYQDIATSDPHPGITGGILSLLFSDTDPRWELEREEQAATKFFNRAAAYRIFQAYKQEYPTAPELAQMYLDIVRLYTATGEPEVAAITLNEFEQRYRDAPQLPEVALKLADCYITLKQYDKERALYQQVLDYLGTHRPASAPLVPDAQPTQAAAHAFSEPTTVSPISISYPPDSNHGIEIPDASATTNTSYDNPARLPDRLDVPTARWRERRDERVSTVTYADVLARFVASLAREERTTDILALYAAEIKKYPAEQGLYEQRLEWLGQTKLLDEQLRVYQAALKQFPDNVWRDRLARWFLRQQRKQDFAQFSHELLAQFNDTDTEAYLNQVVAPGATADAASFEAQLYLGLYSQAHERFPHNLSFVTGLLQFYRAHERWAEWRALMAEYYFVSREIRDQFLTNLAARGELRARLEEARAHCRNVAESDPGALQALPYKLFRADAAAWLSNYEEAVDAYRELNRLYPNTPEYADRLIAFTRSFGQHNRQFLEAAAATAHAVADGAPASSSYRIRAGEIQAELGDYARARGEWEQLIDLGRGEPETYLETATVYWDYFQYVDALRVIHQLRAQANDLTLYAFQAGAILEAQHQPSAALSEYAQALDENAPDCWRARRRLLTLYGRPGIPAQLAHAVATARRHVRDETALMFGYVNLLHEAKADAQASALLRREVATNLDPLFLERAHDELAAANDRAGERLALRRLVAAAPAPRARISYRLQLAESYQTTGETDAATSVLDELTRQYPTNYGVLTETASCYWRLGRRAASLNVLRAGMTRGRGRFHYIFARKLATRELELGHTDAAERVLRALHAENRLNTDVFHELARLYVRTGQRDALQQAFRATVAAIKTQDIGIRDMQAQVAELRTEMIDAFTRLQDYPAAVEQHIEIINRDPDDEENLNAALTYVKRYGGADTLLAYYQKTAQAAYKNYRWNVILARIYEAKGDYGATAANYRAALVNQPEMLELQEALADACERGQDFDGALAALQRAAELSNDEPRYIRRTVALLARLGRKREAEVARLKLPPEPQATPQTARDAFAEAARLRQSERAKSVATYRQAFDAFVAAPYQSDLQAADISGYVQTVRAEDTLDQIATRLWQLRARLLTDADASAEKQAEKARARLNVLDGALPEALGGTAAERATGDELTALFRDWQARVDTALQQPSDPHATLALLQNLCRRAGFGTLEEHILLTQKDAAFVNGKADHYHAALRALVDFYNAAGAYGRIVELLSAEQQRDAARKEFYYPLLISDYARLTGDRAQELTTLRNYYDETGALAPERVAQDDVLVARYFAALLETGAEGRAELQRRAEQTSAHQMQLINFLLAAHEGALAHATIAHAPQPLAWQLARNAEASLALGESDAGREHNFIAALQYKPIGALVTERPDTVRQLGGDDWFTLAARYGEWLYQTNRPEDRLKSRALLPAQIENRPHDAGEQAHLGRWYLAKADPARALIHLQLALEAQPEDAQLHADAGAAYFQLGGRERARAEWRQIIAGDKPTRDACALYLRTLAAHGLAAEARTQLSPILAARLNEASEDEHNYDGDKREHFADYKPLLRALSVSFTQPSIDGGATIESQAEAAHSSALTSQTETDASRRAPPVVRVTETERAAFFRRLCAAAPESKSLPAFVISEPLVARREEGAFYELLIARAAELSSYERDYDYGAQLQRYWDRRAAEEALDLENDAKISEPTSARLTWQQQYLAYLLDMRDETRARALGTEIEATLKGRFARPLWLRLAGLRLELRAGRVVPVVAELKHLVGIEVGAEFNTIKLPDTTRLNEACALLRAEGHGREADELLTAAYTRALALAQYDATYFVGLARLAFKHDDARHGRALLQTMLALAQEETRPAAEAELAAAAWLNAYAVKTPGVELPEPADRIGYDDALKLAADAAADAAQFDLAIACRQHLRARAADDETNRIELVRLLAANGQTDEALQGLAEIISDRQATRRARWQAVWLAPELIGDQAEGWSHLRARVATVSKDTETLTALDALSLVRAGRNTEARALVATLDAADPNVYVRAFRALLDEQDKQWAAARASLTGTLIAGQTFEPWPAFGESDGAGLRHLMRAYLAFGQPRAALRLAERDPNLTRTREQADDAQASDTEDSVHERVRVAFQTLTVRVQARSVTDRIELLGRLSAAAEATGDMARALTFEQARFALLDRGAEKQASAARIARLQAAQDRPVQPVLIVDAGFVARR
jgi:tetratricopeptide (TPR) repeat protein